MKAMRLMAAIMGFVFVAFASVQFNDPDPATWIAVYGAAAFLSLAAAGGRTWPRFSLVFSLGVLVWSLMLLPQVRHVTMAEIFGSFAMKTAAIEEAREGLGLLIVSVWTGILAAQKAAGKSDGGPTL